MRLQLQYKGSVTPVEMEAEAPAQCVFDAAHSALGLASTEWRLKILSKGKQLRVEDSVASHGIADGAKLMVMASSVAAVESGQRAQSDPTVRGFAAEDSETARRTAEAGRRRCGRLDHAEGGLPGRSFAPSSRDHLLDAAPPR